MLKAIWPSIAHLPNHLPPSTNITTSGARQLVFIEYILKYSEGMICFFLYWSIQFPFMFVSPQKIRWLFLAKSIIVPPTWIALLIWAMVKVPPSSGLLSQKAELSGSALSWAWLGALNSALGSFSTLGVNIPDFTVGHTYATPSHLLMYDNPNSEIC
jgi:NCS1 family nucleobase:cation symporter-1